MRCWNRVAVVVGLAISGMLTQLGAVQLKFVAVTKANEAIPDAEVELCTQPMYKESCVGGRQGEWLIIDAGPFAIPLQALIRAPGFERSLRKLYAKDGEYLVVLSRLPQTASVRGVAISGKIEFGEDDQFKDVWVRLVPADNFEYVRDMRIGTSQTFLFEDVPTGAYLLLVQGVHRLSPAPTPLLLKCEQMTVASPRGNYTVNINLDSLGEDIYGRVLGVFGRNSEGN